MQAGLSVTLVDESEKPLGSASLAAGAMLGAYGEVTAGAREEVAEIELQARLRAAVGYPRFLEGVAEMAGGTEPLLGRGTFVIASGRRTSDLVNLGAIRTAIEANGSRWEVVDPDQVPGLAPSAEWPCVGALYLPDEGFVDTHRLLAHLRHALETANAFRWCEARAARVVLESDRVVGVKLDDGSMLSSRWTVLCAGAATTSLLPPGLESCLPLMLWAKGTALVLQPLPPPTPHVIRTPNREFACGLHVVPLSPSNLYVGATNRAASVPGVTGAATAGEVALLLHGVLHEIDARLERADVVGVRHGSRPLSADGLPVAGACDVPGLAVATGTYRNGVLLAPLLGDVVCNEITGRAPTGTNPFSPRGRAARLAARTPDHLGLADAGASDAVAMLLEPGGHLPYGRSAEVAALLRLLLARAFADGGWPAGGDDLRAAIAGLGREELVPEVLQLLLRHTAAQG